VAGKSTDRRLAPLVAGALLAVVLLIGFIWFVRTMLAGKTGKSVRQVQIVQIIVPPPPPPPDQPPPPPPEKTEVPLPKDQPDQPPPPDDAPAPAQPLGIDAEGTAGDDAFGLAARAGGNDLIGGTGSSLFAWYTNKVKDAIMERLSSDTKNPCKKYSTTARITIERDGRIDAQLASTTGNHECDQRIEADLAAMPRMSDPPPPEMPQPVTWKFVQH